MSRLAKGMEAPEFELADAQGKAWRLRDLRGDKVILYFYPADDTPGCTTQACDFRDSLDDLKSSGYQVLGVSPQGAESHRTFADKYGLNFPLLIDEDLAVARRYGVADPRGGVFKGIPLRVRRSTFVIDENGKLIEVLYGVKARGHVDRLREGLASA